MNSSKKILLVVMLSTLMLFGGALIYFTMEYLSLVTQGDAPLTSEIIHQIGLLLLVVMMMAGIPAVGMGAFVMYIGSRICVTGQWPPAGVGFQSKSPIELGRRAQLLGFTAMGLGGILACCGLILPLLGWRLVNVFFPDF